VPPRGGRLLGDVLAPLAAGPVEGAAAKTSLARVARAWAGSSGIRVPADGVGMSFPRHSSETTGYKIGKKSIDIRNRSKSPYSEAELAELVRIASRDLIFAHPVRITFIPRRWTLLHRNKPGWTRYLTLSPRWRRFVFVRINPKRNVVRKAPSSWMTPAQLEKSRSQGYLAKSELHGVEIPLYDLAHELHHAANGRATLSRALRRALETEADTYANKTVEEFTKTRGATKADTWDMTRSAPSP